MPAIALVIVEVVIYCSQRTLDGSDRETPFSVSYVAKDELIRSPLVLLSCSVQTRSSHSTLDKCVKRNSFRLWSK